MEFTNKEFEYIMAALNSRIYDYEADINGFSEDDSRLKQFKKDVKELKKIRKKIAELLED